MVLRNLITDDNVAMARIIRNSLLEFNAAKPGTVYFDPTTDHLSEVFTVPRSAYFVIENKGELAAGGGFFPTEALPENTCELVKMYVSLQFRRKGYGKMLLEKCIEEAKNFGYSKMYLESMPELTNAISMYKKFNFQEISGPLGNSGHNGCSVFMIRDI